MSFTRYPGRGRPATPTSPVSSDDLGGWTNYLTSDYIDTANAGVSGGLSSFNNQTGSRLHFVDPSLTVTTTMLALDQAATYNSVSNPHGGPYLWNGSAIIDMGGNLAPLTGPHAGVPYGTDPMTPGASVQWFKRVSYCLYTQTGANRLNGTVSNGASSSAGTSRYNTTGGRNTRRDWLLLKRGTTLYLEDDIYDLCIEGNPAVNKVGMYGTLVLPKGVIAAAGPATDPRPIVTKHPHNGPITRTGHTFSTIDQISFLHYVGIHIDGYDRSHYTGIRLGVSITDANGFAGTAPQVSFEDCVIAGTMGIRHQANTDHRLELRRCILVDSWGGSASGTHATGIFAHNYGDSYTSVVDSLVGRNGMVGNPLTSPGQGDDNIFTRNFYYSGEASVADTRLENCIVLPGASADQFRYGCTMTNNYMMISGMSITGQNGHPNLTSQPSSGTVQRNVLEQYLRVTAAGGNLYGTGFSLAFGAFNVDLSDNVVTNAGMNAAQKLQNSGLIGCSFSTGGLSTAWYHAQKAPTHDNSIHDNVTIADGQTRMIGQLIEGVSTTVSTNFQNFSGSATWNMAGRTYTQSSTAAYPAGTSTIVVNSVAGFDTAPNLTETWNVGVTMTNGVVHWTTLTAVPLTTTITLTTPLPVGCNSGATVVIAIRDNYTYPCNRDNEIINNVCIGTTNTNANSLTYSLLPGGAITPTDTRADSNTYSGNVHLSMAAAVTAGYDVTRCLGTWLPTIDFDLTDPTDQNAIRQDLIAFWTDPVNGPRRGQWGTNWQGKTPCNYVRAGILGMSPIP